MTPASVRASTSVGNEAYHFQVAVTAPAHSIQHRDTLLSLDGVKAVNGLVGEPARGASKARELQQRPKCIIKLDTQSIVKFLYVSNTIKHAEYGCVADST